MGGPAGGVHGDSPSNSIIIPPGAQTTPGYNLGGYPKMDGYATLSYYMGILILTLTLILVLILISISILIFVI